ncbi:Tn3 family transposase [Actinomadura rudentiformis]|uniref:Tn3 family transposase n=1 Tax=Actinomadura rudentiformis TaxID=359158 RepID=A0A6H9YFU2_9ACTN|nr:Tn3 family transposase [Actinomadura rudentiformis]KAB2344920.1 Tn3 family transposase [Actinomadura rudentiformis]
MPRIDYPELLLEVHARTGMFDEMQHMSGSHLRREDLDITLAALTVARSCNVGLVPVIKPGTPALTEHRLLGVEKGYFHHEGIAAASTRLEQAQGQIDITDDWGGGLVASVDGVRFVVLVRSLYARPSPLYYGVGKRSRGATWLNAVSDKVMGLGGLLVRLHDLRHGAATVMLAAGIDIKIVQEILGHADRAATSDTYTSVLPELAAEAIGQAAAVINRHRLTPAGTDRSPGRSGTPRAHAAPKTTKAPSRNGRTPWS